MQKRSFIRSLFTGAAIGATSVLATSCISDSTGTVASFCISAGTACGSAYYGPHFGGGGGTFYTGPASRHGPYTAGSYSDNVAPYFVPAPVSPSNNGRMGGAFAPQASY